MAEHVHFRMESSIPELEEMERTGLFTEKEIRILIKKRTAFEYTLRRSGKDKEHVLKYIHYEMNVLRMVELRRKRLGILFKKHEIDLPIAKRINGLFYFAIKRFKNDVKLWISQIEFCKRMNWHNTVTGLFPRMLQVHSSNPSLWVMGAKWEMEENTAPDNARQLLQRGLRFNPDSRLLWTEYFRMELMYTDFVLKRRGVFGIQGMKDTNDETDAVLDGSLAAVVYKNAVMAIPGADFALSFIPICQPFSFTSRHIEDIFVDIQNRQPNNEETLNAVARRPLLNREIAMLRGSTEVLSKIEAEIEVCRLFEEAIQKVQSIKMWAFFIDFAMSRMNAVANDKRKAKYRSKVIKLMMRAAESGHLSTELFKEWVILLQASKRKMAALKVAVRAARTFPKDCDLWLFCLRFHMSYREDEMVANIFKEAFSNVVEKDSHPLWLLSAKWQGLLDFFASPFKFGGISTALREIFEKAISCRREVSVPMKVFYLDISGFKEDIEETRNLYRRLRVLYPTSLEFYRKMIEIEEAQMGVPPKPFLKSVYDDAIREYGDTDVDLWIDYIVMERTQPDVDLEAIRMLHYMATKRLNDSLHDDFNSKYAAYEMRRYY